ncbi:glycosyltransferase [Falsiroseomonas sp.]|uniref:glycosyltransferase n=1 Tax=Falsiroseomonas sp. TaxID=2870721 RepID=UPI003567715F
MRTDASRLGTVMQVMAGAGTGGAETFSMDLVIALHEAGLRQVVVTRPEPARLARLAEAGVRCIATRLPFALPPPLGRMAMARIVAAEKPALVQAFMGRAASVAPEGSIGWFGGYYDLKRFRRCRHLIAITPHMRDDMIARGADPAHLSLIPTFAALDPSPALPRESFGTPPGARIVLCLARLHPKKGLDTLLDAIAAMPQATHLWLAGEGELEGALRAQAARLGVAERVHFLGWRTDRGALLRAADVLAVPSRYEPFGTVVIEGWAAGVPVVAASAVGPAATIEDGRTGLVVPVDDARALAAALGRVLEDAALARDIMARAATALTQRYAREAVVAAYLDLYARLQAG